MIEWDASTFEDHLGKKVSWGMVTGRGYSGKKTVAAAIATLIKGKVLNMGEIASELKKKMGTEEEPYEGDVPIAKVEEEILRIVQKDKESNQKFTYIFDSWLHKTTIEFIDYMHAEFGLPNFSIHC
jgi:CO dehydrogenase nickel-insertion accessory protein CooC1